MTEPSYVGGLIAEAFVDLAPAVWIVPDDDVRQNLLAAQFTILAEHALAHGAVHVSDDGSAVAVWFDFTAIPEEIKEYDTRLAAAVGSWLPRFQAFDATLEANHPHDPHYYLALLAVRPGRQSGGLGSQLLAKHHQWLDERGIAAYLEAADTRSRALYLRHGYEAFGEPYHLPEGGPPMHPMWRNPS